MILKNLVVIALFLPLFSMSQEIKLDTKNVKVTFIFVEEDLHGSVGGVEASIDFNVLDLGKASIKGSADVSTLSTGNERRDNHLKSADFFNAEKYPKMTFTSASVEKKGENYVAKGTLTIAGVTNEVSFLVEVSDTTMVFKTSINADDFGVSPKKKEKSTVIVEVTVTL